VSAYAILVEMITLGAEEWRRLHPEEWEKIPGGDQPPRKQTLEENILWSVKERVMTDPALRDLPIGAWPGRAEAREAATVGFREEGEVLVSTMADHEDPRQFETSVYGGMHHGFSMVYRTREEASRGHAETERMVFGTAPVGSQGPYCPRL
jgi:hypothetical protein